MTSLERSPIGIVIKREAPVKRNVPVYLENDARSDRAFEFLVRLVDLEEADRRHPVRGMRCVRPA